VTDWHSVHPDWSHCLEKLMLPWMRMIDILAQRETWRKISKTLYTVARS
jgi:hypothetical protein